MNKRDMLYIFIKNIERKKLLTSFIRNIFDYEELKDYNYLFRIVKNDERVIIDIYDNVSDNRFNRYVFNFVIGSAIPMVIREGNVFVTYIDVFSIKDSDNKLYKLAYLFKLEYNLMINYGKTFLDQEFIDILIKVLKK